MHVIGKGIVRFHAVYWLALLLSAGQPLPTAVLVHDYLTVDGAKLSKSAGNAVSPVTLVETFGADAVRWWLVREPARVGDTDFTVDRLVNRANLDLSHALGNLVNRTVTLTHRYPLEPLPAVNRNSVSALGPAAAALPDRIDNALTGSTSARATQHDLGGGARRQPQHSNTNAPGSWPPPHRPSDDKSPAEHRARSIGGRLSNPRPRSAPPSSPTAPPDFSGNSARHPARPIMLNARTPDPITIAS